MNRPGVPRDAEKPLRRVAVRVTGLQAGIVMALLAVAAGAFFEVRPPDAYGICMSCHARDAINWMTNRSFDTDLSISPASLVFPVLTTIGVVIGAWIAAAMSGEFRWRMPKRPLKNFTYGVVVMNAALIAAGCSTRLALRLSAGDPLGLVGFIAMAAGIALATAWVRWKALR